MRSWSRAFLWVLLGGTVCAWGGLVIGSKSPLVLLVPSLVPIVGVQLWKRQVLWPDPEAGCLMLLSLILPLLFTYGLLPLASVMGIKLGGGSGPALLFLMLQQILLWIWAVVVFLLACAHVMLALARD